MNVISIILICGHPRMVQIPITWFALSLTNNAITITV